MEFQVFNFSKIKDFNFQIKYQDAFGGAVNEGVEQHVHEDCEIYINLSGDVSFMVENHIYPIKSGDIIITRPYEYHHCIYNSAQLHKHFWILFSAKDNEEIFEIFFKRNIGENNHIRLSEEKRLELIELCFKLYNDGSIDLFEDYHNFFKLMSIISGGVIANVKKNKAKSDLQLALNYISNHFSEPILIKDIAAASHMSVNTLERKFEKSLLTTPYNYLRNKRLSNAVRLLSNGENVTDACLKSGFSDCSAFITLFKKKYGMTPLKYKHLNQNNKI